MKNLMTLEHPSGVIFFCPVAVFVAAFQKIFFKGKKKKSPKTVWFQGFSDIKM